MQICQSIIYHCKLDKLRNKLKKSFVSLIPNSNGQKQCIETSNGKSTIALTSFPLSDQSSWAYHLVL